MQQPNSLDPVSALIAGFTVFVGPTLATFLGAYSVIIVGAAVGSGIALLRIQELPRFGAIGFVTLMIGLSSLVTTGVAEIINIWARLDSVHWLLAPVSVSIAGIGHDWPRVVAWGSERLLAMLPKRGE